jgi:hypothetical protein
MKKLPFYLAIVALALLAAQCNPIEPPPDETGIKPQRDIPEKWTIVGYSISGGEDYIFPPRGDILEFWPDSTYKVYTDSVLVGDGTYTYYLKKPGSTYLYPFISLTGYSLYLWGMGLYIMDEEHIIIHFIGDSVCPPSPVNYELPEGLLDSLHAYNLSNEIMMLEPQVVNSERIFFIKIEN